MLTPLQERICRLVGSLPGAESAVLAGGGAMIVHGIVDRATTDLDFFSHDVADVPPTARAVRAALEAAGLRVEVDRMGPSFVRLNVADGDDQVAIDIGPSRRAFPPARSGTVQVLAPEDLAGDKMAALFSRAEARDFVDVFALSAHFSREELYELARDKDTGFVLDRLRDALGMFDHRRRQDFPVADAEYGRLRSWVGQWRAELPAPQLDPPRCPGRSLGL